MIVFITNQSILGKFRQNKKQNLGKKVSKTSNNFSTFFLWAKKTAGLASSYWEFIKCINKVSPNQDYSYAVLLSLGLSRSSCSRQRSLFFFKWDSASRKHSFVGQHSSRHMQVERVSCVSPYYSPSIVFRVCP